METRKDDGLLISPEGIRQALEPFYDAPAALEVATSLINAIVVTESILLQQTSREVAAGAAQMLMDFAISFSQNPFWQKHGLQMSGVFGAAAMARINSYDHAQDRGRSKINEIAHVTARQAICEIAVHVMTLEQGVPAGLKHGPELRRTMLERFGGLRGDARAR